MGRSPWGYSLVVEHLSSMHAQGPRFHPQCHKNELILKSMYVLSLWLAYQQFKLEHRDEVWNYFIMILTNHIRVTRANSGKALVSPSQVPSVCQVK